MQQLLKETNEEYDKFIHDITDMVVQRMGKDYQPRIYKVTKNNSLELDSLVLLRKGKNFAPNIYLLPYYEAYKEGVSMKELTDRLCNIYHNSVAPIQEGNFNYTFNDMKSDIIYRLVNYDRNRKLLEKIPHIRYMDLAITFHCLVHNNEDGIGTIRITNEHAQQWKVTLEELQSCAVINTRKRFPPMIRSMEEVVKNILREENGENELAVDLDEELLENCYHTEQHAMYILSNNQGINGATCLLYDDVLKKFSEKLQSDFYILPSSIHEVILIPYHQSMSKSALSEMVKEVNQTQVADDEILSDRVYFYNRKSNAIAM